MVSELTFEEGEQFITDRIVKMEADLDRREKIGFD